MRKAHSKFQGLVYSEKSIDIAKTQIIGAAVSKDSAGTTKLEDVRAISVPELTKMEFEIHQTLKELMDTNRGGDPFVIKTPGGITQISPNGDMEELKLLAALIAGTSEGASTWQFGALVDGEFDPQPSRATRDFFDSKLKWDSYLNEHVRDQIRKVEIFDIDLNTLISLDIELEMMYHCTANVKD